MTFPTWLCVLVLAMVVCQASGFAGELDHTMRWKPRPLLSEQDTALPPTRPADFLSRLLTEDSQSSRIAYPFNRIGNLQPEAQLRYEALCVTGDYNQDGRVDAGDFGAWQRGCADEAARWMLTPLLEFTQPLAPTAGHATNPGLLTTPVGLLGVGGP